MKKDKLAFYLLIAVLMLFAFNLTANSESETDTSVFKITYSSQLHSQAVENTESLKYNDCSSEPTCNCKIWQVVTDPYSCYCMTTDQEAKFVCPGDCCSLEGEPDPGVG